MKLEYCDNGNLNVGDDLNRWLWPKLLPRLFDEGNEDVFLGVGTLLTEKRMVQQLSGARTISILSSGAWNSQAPNLAPHWKVYGVRGYRTAKWIGVEPSFAVGDGAYLLRQLIASREAPIGNPVLTGFVPHHRSEDFVDWETVCNSAGVKFITPRQHIESFTNQLSECELILSEAMHGAIIADALRIPWWPIKFSPSFQEEKWFDWSEFMGLNLEFTHLPTIYQHLPPLSKRIETKFKRMVNRFGYSPPKWSNLPNYPFFRGEASIEILVESLIKAANHTNGQLSSDKHIKTTEEKLLNAVEKLKSDHC
ncbi:polysaccharide pyruvyl transferase family protein [Marinobacter halodurans]|uniref:Polysaccharide pyruvyl transferase family protein n=1 Tax=Marinobacter halodurans TaxID=2528979 RepID=A0ABY1ZM34_9GAMM|nr:polysaccharide pyruvyl transferase family protein [Marinobacter halodurans]TBW55898.1 polysaccharide pyruvyl transferase family protein [Marinobacter halodurans]